MSLKIQTLLTNPNSEILSTDKSCRSLTDLIKSYRKDIESTSAEKHTVKSFVKQYEAELDEILTEYNVLVYDHSKPITDLLCINNIDVLPFNETPDLKSKKILQQLSIPYLERNVVLDQHQEDFIVFIDQGEIVYKSCFDNICYDYEDYSKSLAENHLNPYRYHHVIEDLFEPYKAITIDQNDEIYTLLCESYSEELPLSDTYYIRDDCVYDYKLNSIFDSQFHLKDQGFSLADFVRGEARIKVIAELNRDLGVRYLEMNQLGSDLRSSFKVVSSKRKFTIHTDLDNEYIFNIDNNSVFEDAVDSAYFQSEPDDRDQYFEEQLKTFIFNKRRQENYDVCVKIKGGKQHQNISYNKLRA